ncbi:hypothetical protein ILUMI_17465 [Ignelater luminosus]|uniref:DDE-1 domain-containing protein n=1 Tax=Ignelater luminosus TaxID=2038154 RepID=A0A8K0CQE7_IGNLU|nr:hypothetical protein ILUMI_17465 [Ignelater luminosus]
MVLTTPPELINARVVEMAVPFTFFHCEFAAWVREKRNKLVLQPKTVDDKWVGTTSPNLYAVEVGNQVSTCPDPLLRVLICIKYLLTGNTYPFVLLCSLQLSMIRHYIKKRKPLAYTAQQLQEAVEAVRLRGMKSTSIGRLPEILHDVEVKMAEQIKIMEKWEFRLSKKKKILLAIGQYVKENGLKTPFRNSVPGDDYFVNFKRRQGLSQKKLQAVEVARKRNVDPFIIAKYFNLLKEVTSNVPPKRIYNIDETSFSLDRSRVKVVSEKGKTAHRVTAVPGKEHFSVLIGANAAGEKLPPLIILKGKNWLAKKDDKYPRSKVVDGNGNACGHSSDTSTDLIEKAMQKQVVILKLPRHTSHLLQPMDFSVFKPLKYKYDETVIKTPAVHLRQIHPFLHQMKTSIRIYLHWIQLQSPLHQMRTITPTSNVPLVEKEQGAIYPSRPSKANFVNSTSDTKKYALELRKKTMCKRRRNWLRKKKRIQKKKALVEEYSNSSEDEQHNHLKLAFLSLRRKYISRGAN